MRTREICISRKNGETQRLRDILPVIETNSILNKTITGIGATYSEIKAPRNSIIIEPTRPVIYGKCNDPKHKEDNLLGVHQGVYKDDVVKYIERSIHQKKRIKILTTPESFKKVLDAFEELDINIRYDGYFLLFDECQKIIKDCDYRPDITLPMDLFFECREKALVSATPPTEFADQRFNDFTEVRIKPDFSYCKEINLHTTNNVLQTTKEIINSIKGEDRPVFLFANSTDMIWSLMKQLDVLCESAVFCSEKSVEKLKLSKFKAAHELWEANKMAKYNWMTSRFYSALDIELSVSPNIIMLSECFVADYTMIDPYMDAVQIIGRFRNGVNRVYHVSNWNSQILPKSKEQIKGKFLADRDLYYKLQTAVDSVEKPEWKDAYRDLMIVSPYRKFLDINGKEDYFKVDNYVDEENVKSYYHSKSDLLAAYETCKYFTTKHIPHNYKIGDYERLKIADQSISIKEKRKIIIAQLELIKDCETEAECQHKRDLACADHFIVEAYDVLGKETIENLNYCTTKIREAIIIKKHQESACSTDAIKLINASFYSQQWYSAKHIKERLKEIFSVLNIPHPKAITSHTINDYFVACEKRKNNGRGYYLVEPRFQTT